MELQWIKTKYLGPTDFKGSRIRASAGSGPGRSVTLSYDHALTPYDNHARAAQALAAKLEMHGAWHCIGHTDTPTGYSGYVFGRALGYYTAFTIEKEET